MSSATNEKVDRAGGDDFSGSEGDGYDGQPRTSEDVRRHDRETLTAEEEAERLLGGGGSEEKASGFGQRFADRRAARRQRRREARREKRSRKKGGREESELMYDMETGHRSSSESSSETDLRRLKETQARQKVGSLGLGACIVTIDVLMDVQTSRASKFGRFAVIPVVIIAAFLAFLYGAYRAPSSSWTSTPPPIVQTLSNGTHTFAPTTLLISLDGFRADFLTRNLTPTLNSFIRSGVSPKYMTPAFPSLTFPNHFTLVTGLHPESHGVVGNTFWDPSISKEFYYTDPDRSMQPEWWNAEPLWLTAERAGVPSAIHMWPGSEAHIGKLEPAYVDAFNGHERLDRKVDRIFSWLDLPGVDDEGADVKTPRPQFIAAYVPNVDQDGHKYGPNSTSIRSTIKEVDVMLASIFHGIDERNLTDIVNIIVVSDHGMATTSINRLIQLEDLIDTNLIEHTDGWPLYGLRPYDHSEPHLLKLYNEIFAKSKSKEYQESFDVYLRDHNMPPRYHFTQNPRIAPLWIVPRTGWAIVTKDEFDIVHGKQNHLVYTPKGLHGYDYEHPLMRAIFVARGPAFPHPRGSRVDCFQSIEVYNIVCDSLGVEPRPNNGTLRLPFRTQGTHDFDEVGVPVVEVPEDLIDDGFYGFDDAPGLEDGPGMFGVPPVVPTGWLPSLVPTGKPGGFDGLFSVVSGSVYSPVPTRPVVHDGISEEEEDVDFNHWLDWVKGKLDAIKWWASEALGWEKEQEGEGKNNATATATETGRSGKRGGGG